MVTNDIGKLAGLLLIAAMAGGLLGTGRMSEGVAAGIIGGVVGYLTGNGVNAVRRNAPSPVLVPRMPDEHVEDEAVVEAARRLVSETAAEQASRQGWPPPPPMGGLAGPPWRGPQ